MRILLADDHPMFLEALCAQIERLRPDVEIRQASTLNEILLHVSDDPGFDLALIDYDMPGIAGIDGVRIVIDAFPQTAVAVISGRATSANVHAAIQAGARGFLPKTLAPDQFDAAFSALLTGATYVPADILRELLLPASQAGNGAASVARPGDVALASLSDRERAVLRGLTEGLSNKEIGRDLSLAEVTIKLHVRQIFKKMGARSRSDAVAKAIRAAPGG